MKHFKNFEYSKYLIKSLMIALDSEGQSLDAIRSSHVRKTTIEKYLSVCLFITTILQESPCENDKDLLSSLLLKYRASCDAVNKAIETLQELNYRGKD